MKIHAIHDMRGEIQHLVVGPAEGPQGSVGVPAGSLMTEVSAPDLAVDLTKPESVEKLAAAIRTFKVEAGKGGRLVKKG